jgi:aminopeptidase N
MKKKFIVACFICFSILVKAQRNIDVLHYRYYIELNDANDTIYGVASIELKALQATNEIELDLANINTDKKGMSIITVLYTPFSSMMLRYSQSGDKAFIKLPKTLKQNDTLSISVEYKGIPADGLIISKNKYGHRTFFSDNWPNRAHNWIPCVDDPADKATVEFIVTAPSHYQIISNGVQIEETNLPANKKLTHWKEDVPLPTKVMVIGAADFAVNNIGDVNCVPVSSWVYPENKTEGFSDYGPAKEILSWYINYIGPYAYKKLANVQSKTTFGGMENASAIFYYENSVTGKQQEDALIAHEIVHQWFGNSATEKSFAHLWLSEGFATYLTHIYIESKYGTDSLNKRMQKERQEVIDFVKAEKKAVVDSTKDYMSLLNANSYQKGGWILHMLRRESGDSIFHAAVRKYYELYAGKNADTKDLQKVFENVSRKNLEQFFKQWLYTDENPKLQIAWKYIEKGQQLSVTVKQLQKTVFNFPLQVAIGISGGTSKPQIKDLRITKQAETFLIPVGRKAYLLSTGIDPFTSLLCEYTLTEVK